MQYVDFNENIKKISNTSYPMIYSLGKAERKKKERKKMSCIYKQLKKWIQSFL